eukprot:376834_1
MVPRTDYSLFRTAPIFVIISFDGHYIQYGKQHPMHPFNLTFDGFNNVQDNGSDTVGQYNISGIYSKHTSRMQLNKTYIRGTGNALENLGHTVKIKLEWNRKKLQFEGPWYVYTHKYEGTGSWIIKPPLDLYVVPVVADNVTVVTVHPNTKKYEGNQYVTLQ